MRCHTITASRQKLTCCSQILVECNVIILTGSATVLRPLWHSFDHHGYHDYEYDVSGDGDGSRATRDTQTSGMHGDAAKAARTHMSNLGDGTSEEYILESRPGRGRPRPDILRTTAFDVAYERDQQVQDDLHLPDDRMYPGHR